MKPDVMKIYWTIDGDTLKLALDVTATGCVDCVLRSEKNVRHTVLHGASAKSAVIMLQLIRMHRLDAMIPLSLANFNFLSTLSQVAPTPALLDIPAFNTHFILSFINRWVGFGLAEAGGMAGSDIVYYEAASNSLVDAFAVQNAKPVADHCQDWSLVAAEKSEGKLMVELSRKLLSSDTMDRNFTDDSYPLLPAAVVVAWGDSAEIQYHCNTCKVAAGVRFHGESEGPDPFAALRSDASVKV